MSGLRETAKQKDVAIVLDTLFYGSFALTFSHGGSKHMLGHVKDGGIMEWTRPGAKVPIFNVEQTEVLVGLVAKR